MKKVLCIVISILTVLCLFASCGGNENTPDAPENGKLSIVCTIFPQYDWVREILGEKLDEVELTLLLDSGTDLHSYQPTAADIMKISSADLFVYVGGESDKWVPDALSAANGEVECLDLIEALGSAAKLESDEGIMQTEAEEEEEAYDEHIWLSLRNAYTLCGVITEKLCGLDPDNADVYRKNATEYCHKLVELDNRMTDKIGTFPIDTIVCADRFPFTYLMKDYVINYYAAFSGCSAESEASFQTVVNLASKVDELGLKCIFRTENPLADIAQTVVQTTEKKNQKILVLDSMQAVTAARAEVENYYSVMEDNINTLIEGLEG